MPTLKMSKRTKKRTILVEGCCVAVSMLETILAKTETVSPFRWERMVVVRHLPLLAFLHHHRRLSALLFRHLHLLDECQPPQWWCFVALLPWRPPPRALAEKPAFLRPAFRGALRKHWFVVLMACSLFFFHRQSARNFAGRGFKKKHSSFRKKPDYLWLNLQRIIMTISCFRTFGHFCKKLTT